MQVLCLTRHDGLGVPSALAFWNRAPLTISQVGTWSMEPREHREWHRRRGNPFSEGWSVSRRLRGRFAQGDRNLLIVSPREEDAGAI